jgi:predicted TIM-barrel fold metal-dependent hydrolase
MKIIDFHTHLDDRWFQASLLSQDEFMAGLAEHHIDAACVFTLMGFYEDCPAHNAKLATRAAQSKKLLPFFTVDPKLGSAAIAETERCLASGKFFGLKFHPWIQAFAPSMVKPTLVEILQRVAAAGLPTLFHDGTPPYSTTFQIAAVARWIESASIVLGHAGLADYTLPAIQLTRDIPNLYACVCGPKPADIRHLVDIAGPEKVLFGSDFGLSDSLILADRLDSVRYAGLNETELEQVLWRTSAKLLHLDDIPGDPA